MRSLKLVPIASACCLVALLCACAHRDAPGGGAPASVAVPDPNATLLVDFEAPGGDPVRWIPLDTAATAPDTQPAAPEPLSRSSLRPFSGLWSEQIQLGEIPPVAGTEPATAPSVSSNEPPQTAPATVPGAGTILREYEHPIDLGASNVLTAQVLHNGPGSDNGLYLASLVLTDSSKTTIEGDAFPITSRWQEVPIDLKWAFDQGLDISRISSIGLKLQPASPGSRIPSQIIQTDAWKAEKRGKVYRDASVARGAVPGSRPPKGTFYVDSRGLQLRVGTIDGYEIDFWDRGGAANAADVRPGFEIFTASPRRELLGQRGTGLFLLDPSLLEKIGPAMRRDADDQPSRPVSTSLCSWPLSLDSAAVVRSHWELVWTSPVAAIVELKQEYGPYDRLGEPAVLLTWRFMIYQWGQCFVHVDWTSNHSSDGGTIAPPVSWALALDRNSIDRSGAASGIQAGGGDAERLLTDLYPASIRNAVQSALPHRMQTGAPVALFGKTAATSTGAGLAPNSWWWASITPPSGSPSSAQSGESPSPKLEYDTGLKVFGVGINAPPNASRGHADCMILINAANALTKAAVASEYLAPPKVVVRQGELDRNFPGDSENDGFVEAYGFQVIRLAGGRAAFTIYPQERPLFYPAYLFTVPAVERDSLDLAHSRVLINIDGKQFADPPQFPDGSFLLQIPYVLDKPVSVEALLVKR